MTMTNQTPTIRKHYPGCYRLSLPNHSTYGEVFSQIKKAGTEWAAELRYANGTLIQYAGIWNTRREAIEELLSLDVWRK